jgi:hypothetical protein
MSQRAARRKMANPQSLLREKRVIPLRNKPKSFTRGSRE